MPSELPLSTHQPISKGWTPELAVDSQFRRRPVGSGGGGAGRAHAPIILKTMALRHKHSLDVLFSIVSRTIPPPQSAAASYGPVPTTGFEHTQVDPTRLDALRLN